MTSRELVEEKFKEAGFVNENSHDLDEIAKILDLWLENGKEEVGRGAYTEEQWVLLNDVDVVGVLDRCKDYYSPKKRLSKTDLTKILEDIATGRLTRKDYDFKTGEEVIIEPNFGERITAVRMLMDGADDADRETIQFINDIADTDYDEGGINDDTEEA